MSNRSFDEVRRRGDKPVDLRDYQRGSRPGFVAPPAAPRPPAPFVEAVPRPISPYEQTRQPTRTKSPLPTLPPKLGRLALRTALRHPLFQVGQEVAGMIARRVPGRSATTVPVLNEGIYDYPGKKLEWTCPRLPGYGDPQYMSYGHIPPQCIAGQAIFNGGTAPGDTLIAWPGSSTVTQWETHLTNGLAHALAWWTTVPFQNGPYPAGLKFPESASPLPAKIPQYILPEEWNTPFPTPQPLPWPALAPETIPIGAPLVATPKPIPFAWLPYVRTSGMPEASHRGNHAPAPVGLVVMTPAPTYEVVPGLGPPVPIKPEVQFKVPGPRVRERKLKISTVARVSLKMVNLVTESGDYIDVFYDALDKDCKRLASHRGLRIMRPQHKLEALYANWNCVDMKKAIKGLIENEVEDRVIGAIGKRIGKFSRQSGRPVGYESGPGAPGKVPKGTNTGPAPWKNWTDLVWP